jgi:hypothetical protein
VQSQEIKQRPDAIAVETQNECGLKTAVSIVGSALGGLRRRGPVGDGGRGARCRCSDGVAHDRYAARCSVSVRAVVAVGPLWPRALSAGSKESPVGARSITQMHASEACKSLKERAKRFNDVHAHTDSRCCRNEQTRLGLGFCSRNEGARGGFQSGHNGATQSMHRLDW